MGAVRQRCCALYSERICRNACAVSPRRPCRGPAFVRHQPTESMALSTDFLVLGSGIAGLTFALRAAEFGEVLLVTKRECDDAATNWAQGGIAAVLAPDDSFEKHFEDTMSAGAGLCHDVGGRHLRARSAGEHRLAHRDRRAIFAQAIPASSIWGVKPRTPSAASCTRGDITGREIQRALLEAVRNNPNVKVLEWHMGVDLITMSKFGGPDQCVGAYVFDERAGKVETVLARATILATGGAGKVYLYTSNPDVASGDGVAMAYRAGAEIANMEFYQFHPTVLYEPKAKGFLLSEALRGEGAVLRLPRRRRIHGTPPRAEGFGAA